MTRRIACKKPAGLTSPSFALACCCNVEAYAELELTWNKECEEPYSPRDGCRQIAF